MDCPAVSVHLVGKRSAAADLDGLLDWLKFKVAARTLAVLECVRGSAQRGPETKR